ncbi:MAG: enoyl-CoA hydratase/isomerase family protein [Acidobacteriia bacterium]|nr:enoyl-CoA hydratase/isomerase family protein [Terriglobia bacterium]
MSYQEILYGVKDGVATITLNRPERLNAWTELMEQEFNQAVLTANADQQVRVILLTGAGRGFCAGADMSLLSAAAEAGTTVSGHRRSDVDFPEGAPADTRKRYSWLLTIPKPIVAAINGAAVGLGFVIPLYCDLRIASSTAKFCTIFAKRGLIAEYGMAWLLPRMVGLSNAMELLMTAKMIDAGEAQRLGLVSRVLPEENFAADAQAFAVELAQTLSPRSLRVMKRQIYQGLRQSIGESIDDAYDEMLASIACDDFKEGVRHFLEKRAPVFKGN